MMLCLMSIDPINLTLNLNNGVLYTLPNGQLPYQAADVVLQNPS